MATKEDYITRIIPHRLGMVDMLHHALTEMTFDDGAKPLEVYVEGKLKFRGNTNAYSNSAIEAGIINARALLEFLGLKVDPKDSTKLKERNGRPRDDDLFIEDFENDDGNLVKITLADVKDHYTGPEEEAEGALARIIHIGHKEIAHPTLGRENTDDDYDMLKIAARGIRALTVSFFFTKLGVTAPESPVSKTLDEAASLSVTKAKKSSKANVTFCRFLGIVFVLVGIIPLVIYGKGLLLFLCFW